MSESTVSLSAPLYGASLGQAASRFFKKYATFSGRASRSEYWWWTLISVVVSTVLYLLAFPIGATDPSQTGALGVFGYVLYGVWALAVIIPTLALTWRRLHDTNRSGGFYFLALIPFVGGIILLVLTLLDSNPAGARFDR